jgi:hypothetical protein
MLTSSIGLRVAQLRLIFCSNHERRNAEREQRKPRVLALTHQFDIGQADNDRVFFPATRVLRANGRPKLEIIDTDHIVQPAPLTPRFGKNAEDLQINNENALDKCNQFWINSFHSTHTYMTVY